MQVIFSMVLGPLPQLPPVRVPPYTPSGTRRPDEIQADLDTFMAFYNFRRTHQGYRVAGRTPAKALYDLIAQQWLLPPISDAAEEVPLVS